VSKTESNIIKKEKGISKYEEYDAIRPDQNFLPKSELIKDLSFSYL
jgi:hypothetical protein